MTVLRGAMLVNPALLALATTVVIVAGKVSGVNLHIAPILAAAAVGLIASVTALLPIGFGGSHNPADTVRNAFAGTVLHVMICAILGAVGVFGLRLGVPFVLWMLGSYWITLGGLCFVFIRALRSPVDSGRGPVESGRLSAN
jgi:hypothetical protein